MTLAVTLLHNRMLMPCTSRPQDFFEPWALFKPFKSPSRLYESHTGTIDSLNSDYTSKVPETVLDGSLAFSANINIVVAIPLEVNCKGLFKSSAAPLYRSLVTSLALLHGTVHKSLRGLLPQPIPNLGETIPTPTCTRNRPAYLCNLTQGW